MHFRWTMGYEIIAVKVFTPSLIEIIFLFAKTFVKMAGG